LERKELKQLLEKVRKGNLGVDAAIQEMRQGHVEQLEFAAVDIHRAIRRGFPEVIYGPGKKPEQIVAIVGRVRQAKQTVLVTRVGQEVFDQVAAMHPGVEYHEDASAIVWRPKKKSKGKKGIVVISAGTADIPVASEAALTATVMGNDVQTIYDIGVAGLHRLLAHKEALTMARVLVVVAGMEGALPSVVSGLTDCPVIGVPTSTGYGKGGQGEAALLSMLNSCAAGLTVVNIDNGFGAGYAAALINRKAVR
jgi:NCAIR mutase (PurE)-related protein